MHILHFRLAAVHQHVFYRDVGQCGPLIQLSYKITPTSTKGQFKVVSDLHIGVQELFEMGCTKESHMHLKPKAEQS